MTAKVERILHLDNVVSFVLVLLLKLLQDLDFNQSLVVETLLVTNNLESEFLPEFVVVNLDDLTKRSLAE